MNEINAIKLAITQGEKIIKDMDEKIDALMSIKNKVIESNLELSKRLDELNNLVKR